MAETTGIAWCDSTFNPWIGCTKVSPGCDHCYAEALDNRHRWQGTTHWGVGKPRMRTSEANWRKPLAWNKAREKDGKTHRVFCASLADVFDNEVPVAWRTDLFRLIAATPRLTWLLLTKRIVNAPKMIRTLPDDAGPLPNVWIGASIVNQEEADRDIPKLLATPAAVRFISYEPALGPIDFGLMRHGGIHWVIVGGESRQGGKARPFYVVWARDAIEQCKAAGVSCFVKQLGSRPLNAVSPVVLSDRAGADPAEWPSDVRIREFPIAVRA